MTNMLPGTGYVHARAARPPAVIPSKPSYGHLPALQHAAERLPAANGAHFQRVRRSARRGAHFPFDLIPASSPPAEVQHIERGWLAAHHASTLPFDDIYHDQKISQGRRHPSRGNPLRRQLPEAVPRLNPPGASGAHITGTDRVRDRDGRFYVLEDNLRALGRQLRAGEPRGAENAFSPRVFEVCCAGGQRVPSAC